MLGYVTPVGTNAADPLSDVTAAAAFWQVLPRSDPVAAQKALSGALADLTTRRDASLDHLRAVLALDQRARNLIDALLVNYGDRPLQPSSMEKPYWQAAFELCRSFSQAHIHFLRSMRDSLRYRGWREYLPSVLMRLFQHQQIELLLRPFVNELSTQFSWKDLHEAFQFANSRGLLHQPLPVSHCRTKSKIDSTLEREYIHVLLQGLVNGGQFPPHDAFWISQRIPRWYRALSLESHLVHGTEHRFVIGLDSDAGLARLALESSSKSLYLDTAPTLESIRDEIAVLRDSSQPVHEPSRIGRGRQLKLLRKLNVLFSPKPPHIARRGERKPVALAVEIVIGLVQIIRAVRNKPQPPAVAVPAAVPEIEEITITEFGGFTEGATGGLPNDGNTISLRTNGDTDAARQTWKLVDRSDSGCRLQGQVFGSNRVTPGTIVAFREDSVTPWTLAVVRRVEKRPGGRMDIGVEYVGKDPRGVMVADGDDAAGSPPGERKHYAALFLPESPKHPLMPIKTLVLPARQFAPDACLMLQSATASYTINLKEPLDEQSDFIWTPFEVVERSSAAEPAAAKAA